MQAAESLETEPIIIQRSVNREGQTFALDPMSKARLREALGDALRLHPRVFIAHGSKSDIEALREDLALQVVQLLTGVSAARLDALGGFEFRDGATDEPIRLI